jgi:hypothetical protein
VSREDSGVESGAAGIPFHNVGNRSTGKPRGRHRALLGVSISGFVDFEERDHDTQIAMEILRTAPSWPRGKSAAITAVTRARPWTIATSEPLPWDNFDPSGTRPANPPLPKRMSKISKSFVLRLRRWRRRGRWARRKFAGAPRTFRIAGIIAVALATLMLTNLIYQVIHKPTELFFFVGHKLDKEPVETWRQYGPLFRAYSTHSITSELLAALAQVESSGNPVDRTYWR